MSVPPLTESKRERLISQLLENQRKRYNAPRRILLLGNTGVGKSSLGSFLLSGNLDEHVFESSMGAQSDTRCCQESDGHFLGNQEYIKICVCDTPGLDDSGGQQVSEKNFSMIREHINKRSFHAVLVILNTRMNGTERRLFSLASEALMSGGDESLTRLAVVFNHFQLSGVALSQAQREVKDTSFRERISTWRSHFQDEFARRLLVTDALKVWKKQELLAILLSNTDGADSVPAHAVEALCQNQVFFLNTWYVGSSEDVEKQLSASQFKELHEWLRNWEVPISFRFAETTNFHETMAATAARGLYSS